MEEIISKGLRLRKPIVSRIALRGEVYEQLCQISDSNQCSVNVLIQGIVEDFVDRLDKEVVSV